MSKVIFENDMPKRILIADDSVTIQRAFAMTFGAEDVSLLAARSADEGLTLARQNRPDLIIADATMPGRSGYELCAAIKAEGGLRGTPVYILASTQQPFDEAKARQVGADGHFIKPFESTAIIEKVREAMTKGVTASPEQPTVKAALPVSPLARPVVPPRTAPSMPASGSAEEEYGEISVDLPRESARPAVPAYAAPARSTLPAMPIAASAAPAPAPPMSTGMRPSLIPGVRPGSVAPARPGTQPVMPLSARPMGPGAAPPAQRAVPVPRTLMGLPAANAPIPGSMRPPGGSYPGAMPQARTAPPSLARPAASVSSGVSSLVASAVDQKMAALAAKGPEYEAIAKLSREIIEQVVWEVVPELAEAIIREHVEKRGRI
jgi:CheY-like chemotaxis protein